MGCNHDRQGEYSPDPWGEAVSLLPMEIKKRGLQTLQLSLFCRRPCIIARRVLFLFLLFDWHNDAAVSIVQGKGMSVHDNDSLLIFDGKEGKRVGILVDGDKMFSVRKNRQILWVVSADGEDGLHTEKSVFLIDFKEAHAVVPGIGAKGILSIVRKTKGTGSGKFIAFFWNRRKIGRASCRERV